MIENECFRYSLGSAAWIKVPPAALSPPFTSALYRFGRAKYISPGSFFMGARRRKPRGGLVGGGPEAAFHLWLDTFFAAPVDAGGVLLWRLSRLLLQLLHKSFSFFHIWLPLTKANNIHTQAGACKLRRAFSLTDAALFKHSLFASVQPMNY